MARIPPRLLAEIAGLFESDYVTERLHKATTPEEIIDAIRAAQQVVTDVDEPPREESGTAA